MALHIVSAIFLCFVSGTLAQQIPHRFTYESITPQRIITGCRGTELEKIYYIVDGSGLKKQVQPGSSVEVIFPFPMDNRVTRKQLVRFVDICFPIQCKAPSCGNEVFHTYIIPGANAMHNAVAADPTPLIELSILDTTFDPEPTPLGPPFNETEPSPSDVANFVAEALETGKVTPVAAQLTIGTPSFHAELLPAGIQTPPVQQVSAGRVSYTAATTSAGTPIPQIQPLSAGALTLVSEVSSAGTPAPQVQPLSHGTLTLVSEVTPAGKPTLPAQPRPLGTPSNELEPSPTDLANFVVEALETGKVTPVAAKLTIGAPIHPLEPSQLHLAEALGISKATPVPAPPTIGTPIIQAVPLPAATPTPQAQPLPAGTLLTLVSEVTSAGTRIPPAQPSPTGVPTNQPEASLTNFENLVWETLGTPNSPTQPRPAGATIPPAQPRPAGTPTPVAKAAPAKTPTPAAKVTSTGTPTTPVAIASGAESSSWKVEQLLVGTQSLLKEPSTCDCCASCPSPVPEPELRLAKFLLASNLIKWLLKPKVLLPARHPLLGAAAAHILPKIKSEGETSVRNEADYYSSLPGAVRGSNNVIYYPSCDLDAFHQPAIVSYCVEGGNGSEDLQDIFQNVDPRLRNPV